ncbi:uncharacterized protein LOC143607881 [Bidens hawaiensis]|uniref:uncharacterized protein LOC143607881 n=1 Tax=Bidens hawaiensis TaxID=980011 RepID=UPI004049D968
MESAQYTSWSELFKIHCKAFMVFDHLSNKKPPTPAKPEDAAKDLQQWERINPIVLQWIYGTISQDLIHTILRKNTTACDAWEALEAIFQDNKTCRAIYLANKLSNTSLDAFPNCTAYCQELKMLADQLSNVGKEIDDNQLDTQLITCLNEAYGPFATVLQQTEPLPSFYNARS